MLLDTSAWVEFFKDTEKRETVWAALNSRKCFTSIVTLAELSNWCLKNHLEEELRPYVEGIKANSQVLDASENIAITAGKLNYEMKKAGKKWGMIDSIITATAQAYGLRVLTKDSHFSDLPNVLLL